MSAGVQVAILLLAAIGLGRVLVLARACASLAWLGACTRARKAWRAVRSRTRRSPRDTSAADTQALQTQALVAALLIASTALTAATQAQSQRTR